MRWKASAAIRKAATTSCTRCAPPVDVVGATVVSGRLKLLLVALLGRRVGELLLLDAVFEALLAVEADESSCSKCPNRLCTT